jgi:hypothetical protein
LSLNHTAAVMPLEMHINLNSKAGDGFTLILFYRLISQFVQNAMTKYHFNSAFRALVSILQSRKKQDQLWMLFQRW